ncbi:MAG: dephospho-CoA kinase [Nanoarchaeota archaeon]
MNHLIGITGNICSGKSTVASVLKRLNAVVVSHDTFLYDAYTNPGCKAEIANCLGDAVFVDGSVDRTCLKSYLKEHPEDCKKLWGITDKYTDPVVEKFLQGNADLVFFECAPLYEKSWDKFCRKVIFCYTSDDLRIRRLMERARKRDGFDLSEQEAIAVIKQQTMSQEEKMKRADYTVHNDGDFESLERQTIALYNQINQKK